jgi:hypothetical protein
VAVVARDRGGDALRARARGVPPPLRRPRERESDVEGGPRRERARSTTGRARPTSRARRSSTASR